MSDVAKLVLRSFEFTYPGSLSTQFDRLIGSQFKHKATFSNGAIKIPLKSNEIIVINKL